MTDRRTFVAVAVAAALAVPSAARSQQTRKPYRIGFLWDSPGMFPEALDAFRTALKESGWIEGQNIVIEFRWTDGRFERLSDMAADLARLKVDVIVAPSSIYTGAAKSATSTIPIVFLSHADPIGSGHVSSLAHPGGNITGLSLMMTETNAKLLTLFKEAVPPLKRVSVIYDPATPSHAPGLKALRQTAPSLGVELHDVGVRTSQEFEEAFAAIDRKTSGGVLVLSTPLYIAEARRLADLAIKHRLPSMFGPRAHAEAGGLLSYGPDRADLWRRGASYVDRILKGGKPADLPVQQPTKFELVINLKTAKALGIRIPEAVLVRAETVIQ